MPLALLPLGSVVVPGIVVVILIVIVVLWIL
ncbi:hypothetical protein BH10ACT11_BH10ACT11_19970 [soil metagenome]|jgi:hypothetical protein